MPAVERLVSEVHGPSSRRVAGMPAPVWTMLLWLLMMIALGALSRIQPMADDLPAWPRYIAGVFIVGGVISILILRARTPTWLLHVLVIAMIGLTIALVASATNVGSAVSPMMLTMVVATYTSFWMPIRVSLLYVLLCSFGILAADILNPNSGRPYAAWLIVTSLGIAVAFLLGSLIADLKRQAVTDPLTGLLNRSGLALLTSLKPGAGRVVLPRTLVVLDLDDFKRVNDERGHLAGDDVLRDFATAMMRQARADDVLARSGGDEFILVLPGTSTEGAEAMVGRLAQSAPIAFSHGVADWGPEDSFDIAMARADAHMYERKGEHHR